MNNLKWNLDNIYEGINSEKFKNDLSSYKNALEEMNCWCSENLTGTPTTQTTTEYIERKNALLKFSTLSTYLEFALSVDSTNGELAKALNVVEDLNTYNAAHESLFTAYLSRCDNIDDLIGDNLTLNEHIYYLKCQYRNALHCLSPKEEEIISKMKATGSSAWEKQWEQLTSTVAVDINGSEESLSAVRNYAYSDDKELRKTAYECELKAYEKINLAGAFSLNSIKGQVITEAEMRKYSSPLEMTLENSGIDEEILNVMWSAIKEKQSVFENYFIKKAEFLGYENGLPFYELFAPVGESSLTFTVDEAKETVLNAFKTFSNGLYEFAKNAFDKNWIDFMPAKGKVGGAFCGEVHPLKESRIMTNFGGSYNDVVTIAHELGHGYHNSRLYDSTELNSSYPMPIAETASTFCEAIINNYMLNKVDEQTKMFILENDIRDCSQSIIDIYSRFLFEYSFFAERKKGSLTVDEINNLMVSAQKQAYGKGLDENYLHPYMWLCKPHYYDCEFNYYNFPYAFGLLLSRGFFELYKKLGSDFVPVYNEMLGAAGTNYIKDVAYIAGIDLYDKNFWLAGLGNLEKEINELIELMSNS